MTESLSSENQERRERGPIVSGHRSLASEDHPSRNEDAVLDEAELKLWGVFDGIGYHAAGAEASRSAASAVRSVVADWPADDDIVEQIPANLLNALQYANREVVAVGRQARLEVQKRYQRLRAELGEENPATEEAWDECQGFREPGTTAVVAKLHEYAEGRRELFIAWAGDSRAYVLTPSDQLAVLTQDDDKLANTESRQVIEDSYHVDLDEAAIARYRKLLDSVESEEEMPDPLGKYLFRNRSVITAALGGGGSFTGHTARLEAEPDTLLVLTSDGVHDNLRFEEIQDLVAAGGSPDAIAQRIAQAAYDKGHLKPQVRQAGKNARNKRDDISVVVVRVP